MNLNNTLVIAAHHELPPITTISEHQIYTSLNGKNSTTFLQTLYYHFLGAHPIATLDTHDNE